MFNDSNLDKGSDIKSISSVKNLRHQFVYFVNSKTPHNLYMVVIVNAVIIIIIIIVLMLFFLLTVVGVSERRQTIDQLLCQLIV